MAELSGVVWRSRLQLDRQTTPLNSANLQADPDTSAPSISTVDSASWSGNRRGPLPSQTRRRIQPRSDTPCVVDLRRGTSRGRHTAALWSIPKTVVPVNGSPGKRQNTIRLQQTITNGKTYPQSVPADILTITTFLLCDAFVTSLHYYVIASCKINAVRCF